MPSSRRSGRRPYAAGHVPLDEGRLGALTRTETGADGQAYHVRRVRGSAKSYRCPGCDQLIEPGTDHLVAWPGEHLLGAEAGVAERRHWHTACWQARDRRRPTRR